MLHRVDWQIRNGGTSHKQGGRLQSASCSELITRFVVPKICTRELHFIRPSYRMWPGSLPKNSVVNLCVAAAQRLGRFFVVSGWLGTCNMWQQSLLLDPPTTLKMNAPLSFEIPEYLLHYRCEILRHRNRVCSWCWCIVLSHKI